MLPLEGITIISLEQAVAAPFATRQLADLGARVIKIERPEVGLIVLQLLEDADVFIQNLAPGAAERLGLGPEELAQRYPRLIVCAISGYGASGPYRDKKAYDLLVQCETGLVSATGTPETPAKVGI